MPAGFADGIDNTDALWQGTGIGIFYMGSNVDIGLIAPGSRLQVIANYAGDSIRVGCVPSKLIDHIVHQA